ncbi:MAG: hypothetical protein ABI548_03970 [Polyangiaceae bacterium]
MITKSLAKEAFPILLPKAKVRRLALGRNQAGGLTAPHRKPAVEFTSPLLSGL